MTLFISYKNTVKLCSRHINSRFRQYVQLLYMKYNLENNKMYFTVGVSRLEVLIYIYFGSNQH